MKTQSFLRPALLILSFCALSQLNMNSQTIERKRDLDLVFIGNSITQGVQLENPQTDAPPATASEYLRQKPGVKSVAFLNKGRSGFTTLDFMPSVDGTLSKVIEATRQFHTIADRLLVFSISLGTNDSAEKGPHGSPVDPVTYQNNIKAIADQLLADFPNCKIIIQQPIWYSPNTYNHSKYMAEGLARLQSYFPLLKSLIANYSKSNPGHVFMGDLTGFAYFSANYLTDLIPETGNAGTFYLHPNKKGAVVLGRLWGEAIYNDLFTD